MSVAVSEMFMSLQVRDMNRATAFYQAVFAASVSFASPRWTSLVIAGVRLGLFHNPAATGGRTGLHFVVPSLDAALAEVTRAGGRIVSPIHEVAPGVTTTEISDSDGNQVTIRAS